MALQVYFDRGVHSGGNLSHTENTFDIDYQQQTGIGVRQEIMWGICYRYLDSHTEGTPGGWFEPPDRSVNLLAGFVQDDIDIASDRLRLTLGSKFERNDHTGIEVQPNVRMVWTPRACHTLWAAFSRAVRTPSRAELEARLPSQVIPPGVTFPDAYPTLVVISGSRDFESEDLLAYELGYRFSGASTVSFDAAGFYNKYEHLRTIESGIPYFEHSAEPHYVLPMPVGNGMHGYTYGFELATDFQPVAWWRLRSAYTYLRMVLTLDEMSTDTVSEYAEGESPRHQFSVYSWTDLPHGLEFDTGLRYVDELPSLDLDRYTTLDMRLGWRLLDPLEVSVVGQNLLEMEHVEMMPDYIVVHPTEMQRGVYGMITWRH